MTPPEPQRAKVLHMCANYVPSEDAPPGAPNAMIEIDAAKKTARITGPNLLAVLTLVGVIGIGVVTYTHLADARESNAQLAAAVKEMTHAQKQNVEAQREMNCLIAMPAERREREFMSASGLCKQLSRER